MSWFLDHIPVEVIWTVPECEVLRANYPHYIAFAKRAFHFYYNFNQPTADNEVEVLKQEFLLRGLQECALDQIIVIAKQVGEDAKAADAG